MSTPITLTVPAAGAQSGVATHQASGKYFLLTAINGTIRVLTNQNDEYSFQRVRQRLRRRQLPQIWQADFL